MSVEALITGWFEDLAPWFVSSLEKVCQSDFVKTSFQIRLTSREERRDCLSKWGPICSRISGSSCDIRR